MKQRYPTVIFLGDGMADEPIPSLGGKTPLQYAQTPGMDSIANAGRSGTLLTLPAGFPTSSEVANMSVLGCDLSTEYCGRGPLEAAGRGIALGPTDIAFRLNLTTTENGILTDYSGGHISQEEAVEAVAALDRAFGGNGIRFHPGVSYRTILVLPHPHSARIKTEKPDDHQGDPVGENLPRTLEPAAEPTADLLRRIIAEAPAVLEALPFNRRRISRGEPLTNGVWPWSGGKAGALRTLKERFGIRGAVISAVDVIVGLGRCLGMEVIHVPGATGYIDTNYEGKADAAIDALKKNDLVYVHVEAIDEVSHAGDLKKKIAAIEDFDRRLIQRVLRAIDPEVTAVVLPDHPVPIALRKHTRTPVPVSVRMAGVNPDAIMTFNEIDAPRGQLGALHGDGLMKYLFG